MSDHIRPPRDEQSAWPHGPQRFDRDLARTWRAIKGEPEPFPKEFLERLLATFLAFPKAARAFRAILNAADGAP